MKKRIIMIAFTFFLLVSAIGCGSSTPLTIWVGAESVDFYTQKMQEYVTNYNANHDKPFPYEVSVVKADTASAAATFLDDPQAGADIFTVAHDNLGKLIAGSSSIAPITDPTLLAQINNDNPQTFLNVIKGTVNGTQYTFGVPYIAQSLVLYYNTKYITPVQAQSWEGIQAAAKAKSADTQAVSLLGTDGYNNSFLLLATEAENHYTTLQLYTDGVQSNCYALGDDTVAKFKWGQRFFNDPNGAKRPSDSGWEVELKNETSLSLIGGAWNFNAAKAALGDNLGIAELPTFTITADDAYGTISAGTVFKSGTFVDTKMFVMKKNSDKADYLQDILLYLSSKQVQEQSFAQCENLPAYKNARTEFPEFLQNTLSADLANAEVGMFDWGIPQPFGYSSAFNTFYYSKGAPDLFMEILENKDGAFSTDQAIKDQLTVIQSLWTTGLRPA